MDRRRFLAVTAGGALAFALPLPAAAQGKKLGKMIDFCRTLGASPRQITRSVRVPNALAWAFTALPNAVSFALIGVVICEFVGSTKGMGYLMITSLATLNATDMFTSVVVLSAVGVALVTLIRRVERRLLRWAPEFRT